MPEFGITLDVSVERRSKQWAVWANGVDFVAYGSTEDAAMDKVREMLQSLALSFEEPGEFEAYLQDRGIQYLIRDVPELVEGGDSRPEPSARFFSGMLGVSYACAI
ncbi:MAG: hypothetical protein OXE87_01045 [Chloroflexi bacterium]|nr:hypothetical protein [Chloroflexota bacterium]